MLSASYAYVGPVKCLLEKYQSNIGEKKSSHFVPKFWDCGIAI